MYQFLKEKVPKKQMETENSAEIDRKKSLQKIEKNLTLSKVNNFIIFLIFCILTIVIFKKLYLRWENYEDYILKN